MDLAGKTWNGFAVCINGLWVYFPGFHLQRANYPRTSGTRNGWLLHSGVSFVSSESGA